MLVLLFVKYISDKYAGQTYAPIQVPEGSSFADMVALKGNSEIGDLINKKILRKLAEANGLSDMPDFNDSTKLGDGKEKIERLTNLIAIFENPALDFSKNRADGDDLLGGTSGDESRKRTKSSRLARRARSRKWSTVIRVLNFSAAAEDSSWSTRTPSRAAHSRIC
ncbi:MAG TPA: hypothetical protein VLB68_17470 [Pyrinomonadaceae bacterium]|nr:hypothetical protein [Pyrinomonadaceae bacterium]